MCKNKKCLFFAHSQCHTLCNQSFSIHWYICQWACWRLKLFSANTWNSKPSLTAENVKFATKGWFNGIPSHRRVLMLVVSQIEPAWQAVRIRPLTQGWHHNHTLRAPVICFECPLHDKNPKAVLEQKFIRGEYIYSTSFLHRSLLGLLFRDMAEISFKKLMQKLIGTVFLDNACASWQLCVCRGFVVIPSTLFFFPED